jgi:hypothetical protein
LSTLRNMMRSFPSTYSPSVIQTRALSAPLASPLRYVTQKSSPVFMARSFKKLRKILFFLRRDLSVFYKDCVKEKRSKMSSIQLVSVISLIWQHVSTSRCHLQAKSMKHMKAIFLPGPFIYRGTRWRSWLRHCATSRKVAGSIPDGIFH